MISFYELHTVCVYKLYMKFENVRIRFGVFTTDAIVFHSNPME